MYFETILEYFLKNFVNYMNERLFECIKLNLIHFA